MQTFRNYLAVGGMPQAVSAYVDGKDFVSIDRGKRNILKLYIKDLQKHDEDDSDRVSAVFRSLVLDDIDINQGMIFENMVAQMLRVSGYDLYFHEYEYKAAENESQKHYEIDFLIVKGKSIVPLEVKSSDYKNHKSFDYFKEKYQLKMNERYIIYTKDVEWKDDILFMPIYMTMCL